MGRKADAVLSPLDILKPEGSNLTSAHPIGVEQLQEGEVTSTERRASVDALQGLLGIRLREGSRKARQLVSAYGGKRLGEIALQVALLKTEAKKRTQNSLPVPAQGGSFILGVAADKGHNLFRQQPA